MTVAHDAEIFRLDLQSASAGGRAAPAPHACHGAAARNVATRTESAFPKRSRARLGRTPALFGDRKGAGLSITRRLPPPGSAGLEAGQQISGTAACTAASTRSSRSGIWSSCGSLGSEGSCASSGGGGGSDSAPARAGRPPQPADRVARGARTKLAANATSSSSMRSPPRRAASARAVLKANRGGRDEATPSRAATTTSASITDASTSTSPSFARAAARSSRNNGALYFTPPDRRQVDPITHPVHQRLRRALVIALALVEGDHADPRGHLHREPVALQIRSRPCRAPRKSAPLSLGAALRHGQHKHASIRLRNHPGARRRAVPRAASPRCPAHPAIGRLRYWRGARRTGAPVGSASSKRASQASRTGPGAGPHDDAVSDRVNRKHGRGEARAPPGRCGLVRRAHAGNISWKARSTRTAEPASSSGLRRKRWLERQRRDATN